MTMMSLAEDFPSPLTSAYSSKESVHVPTDIFAYEKHDILCIYVAVAVHVAHYINLRAVGDDPYLGELQSASRGNKAVVRKNAFTVGCDYVNTTAAQAVTSFPQPSFLRAR